jgi:hypothetical protein
MEVTKMTECVKKHFLLSTVLFSLLFISCLYSIMAPSAYAAEETLQETGLVISNDVIGLDLTKYAIDTKEFPQDSYLGVIPQERIRYNLQFYQSKLDMLYTFINGNLQKIHVLEVDGSPQMTIATDNPLEMARDFLGNYCNHTGDSFYGELRSTLATVDLNKNLTAISGNKKLEVTTSRDSTTFRWTYTFNGVEAPDKCVALRYKNGFLKYFIDNWDLFKIGNTNINLSEQEAIDIAIARAKTLTWGKMEIENDTVELKYNVTNAMVWETIFAPSHYMDKARSKDLLELYPMRHIWVSLDKFYPGNVYGINVYVWADTGEIGFIKERFSTMDPPPDLVATYDDIVAVALDDGSTAGEAQSSSLSLSWIALPAVIVFMLVAVPVYLSKKKKGIMSFNLPKLRSFKVSGVLLCLLLFSSTVMVVMSASIANATPFYGRATIWGSESVGAWNPSLEFSWRKHPDEVAKQEETADFLKVLFWSNGYSASDYQGEKGSYKDTILAEIEDNELNYPRVAVVDFDHGVGLDGIPGIPADEFHYMFEDNYGTFNGTTYPGFGPLYDYAVFDMDIADQTTEGKTFFAFINTCASADISLQGPIPGTSRDQGMPYAWTHRRVDTETPGNQIDTNNYMSDEGYKDPDYGDFCYIGFLGGSASLSQAIEGSWAPYHYWLKQFFGFALADWVSIKAALDDASHEAFYGKDFDETNLYKGFIASWPFYIDGEWTELYSEEDREGKLKVYGNAYKKLYQPLLTWNAKDNHNNPLYPTFSIDGQPYSSPGISRLVGKFYTIDVSDIPGYSFHRFSYNGQQFSIGARPINIQIVSDGGELTAHYLPIYHDVNTGSYLYTGGQYQQFPIEFYIDDAYAGPTGGTYPVTEGEHDFEVPYVAWAWPGGGGGGGGAIVFTHWFANGWPYYGPNRLEDIYISGDCWLFAIYEVQYFP